MASLFPRQSFPMPEVRPYFPVQCAAANEEQYDEMLPEGGNPLAMDVNAQYEGYTQHWVYQIVMAFFVFLIIPGLGKIVPLPLNGHR